MKQTILLLIFSIVACTPLQASEVINDVTRLNPIVVKDIIRQEALLREDPEEVFSFVVYYKKATTASAKAQVKSLKEYTIS